MIKVGIVTFPRYFNYGTHLQMYALQKVVTNLGYRCEVIDYHRLYWTADQKTELRQRQWNRLKTLLADPLRVLRHQPIKNYNKRFGELTKNRVLLFEAFLHDHIKLGSRRYKSFHELKQLPPNCNAFVVGSDQVWNPVSHLGDSSYYLVFADQKRRVAYAPSIGMSEIPDEAKEWMRSGLLGIPHLSVRERKGAELIRELTGVDARVVLDPTFLLSAPDWEEVSILPQRARPYMLCYFLESDVYMRDCARHLARSHDCDLVVIPVNRVDVDNASFDIQKEYDVGPREFLGLLKNATFVCTDSFHGTVFSIIFERPFFAFRRYANEKEAALHSRISGILDITGLTEREMTRDRSLPADSMGIDYVGVKDRLEPWRQESLGFLRNALQEATL